MSTIWAYTDNDGDKLDVSVHTDGYYFTIRDTDATYRTVVVPGEDAVRLAGAVLGQDQADPPPNTPETDIEPEPEPEPEPVLTPEQQQRQEALGAARVALTASGLARGTRVDDTRQLIAVAHYVAAGDRDYLLTDGEHVHHGAIESADVVDQ